MRAFEQRGEHLDHGALRAGGEVGDLHGRERRRGVLERARVPEVVQVVAGVERVRAARAEPGDRAEDRRPGELDAETLPHSGTEALEHHVGIGQHGGWRVGTRVPGDDLLAVVERAVRGRIRVRHGVALGGLDLHHARAEPQQLAACEGAGEVAREVRDGDTREWLHARGLCCAGCPTR